MPKRPKNTTFQKTCILAIIAAFVLQPMLLPTPVEAADKPSWNCLPAETVVALRIPNGKMVFEALKNRTKAGNVLFNDERVNNLKELIKKADPQEWEQMEKELAKFNFTIDDFPAMYAGESGFALVMDKYADNNRTQPLLVGLMWVDPGEDLAGRAIKALERALAMAEDNGDQKPKRVDFEIGGQKVTHLAAAEMGTTPLPPFPKDFENMSPEEIQEFFRKRAEARKNAQVQQVDQTNIFLTQMGGKLLMAVTFPQNAQALAAANNNGGEVNFNKISGVEEATGIFARFLNSHKGGEDGTFVSKMLAQPGVQDALPSGLPMFEILADARPLLAMLNKEQPQVGKVLDGLGLDKVGALAMRFALDGNDLRSGMFINAPAPRTGILALMEENKLPAEIPAWVPNTAVDYTHMSMDLGKLYLKIKEVVIKEFGEQSKMMFNMVEAQMQAQVQSDLATVLSSIGAKHSIVSFTPKGNVAQVGPAGPMPQIQRQAWVWNIQNEGVWNNMFTMINNVAQGGGAQKVQEQGFDGYRFGAPPMEIGLFKGKGFLVAAIGQGVSEEILSVLNNPPAGEGAMRNSPGYQRARQLLKPKDGISYQYVDMDRYSKSLARIMLTLVEGAMVDAPADVRPLLKKLIPSEKELEDLFGVGGSHMYMNDHGMVAQSAIEFKGKGGSGVDN